MMTTTSPPARALRVYASLRTAHLERFRQMTPADIVYHRTRYDYDPELADRQRPPRRISRFGAVRLLLARSYRAVELNEPLMVERWLDLLGQIAAARVRGLLSRRQPMLGAYCISLTDPAEALRERWRLPRWLGRVVSGLLVTAVVAGLDRVAFGTSGSRALYRKYVPGSLLDRRSRVFEALPQACACSFDADESARASTVLFLGAFSERKGIENVLQGWDALRSRRPDLRLRLIGKGGIADTVTAWAATRSEVWLQIDPPRAVVHQALRSSAALVLLSRRVGSWREQVGLPIIEALAHGCPVITTTETGLAAWLAGHGHTVVDQDISAEELADTIAAVVDARRPVADVLADLPATDSRIDADNWLMDVAEGGR